jgi:hypothetical protein
LLLLLPLLPLSICPHPPLPTLVLPVILQQKIHCLYRDNMCV